MGSLRATGLGQGPPRIPWALPGIYDGSAVDHAERRLWSVARPGRVDESRAERHLASSTRVQLIYESSGAAWMVSR